MNDVEALKPSINSFPEKTFFIEDSIHGFDGKILHLESWTPYAKPWAVLLVIHSIGDHINRYKHFANYFAEHGIAVMGIDMHGYGKSQGRKGIAKFKHLLSDVKRLIEYTDIRFPHLPKIVYGHGLGGNLALTYATRNNSSYAAIISSSPWIRVVLRHPLYFRKVMQAIVWFYPSVTVKNKIKSSDLSHNVDCVSAYDKDPLAHCFMSAKLLFNLPKAGEYLLRNKHKINKPLLLMHGSNDCIASWHATTEFAKYTSQNTTLKIWKGDYHELHNEIDKEDIFEFILQWINQLPGIH